MMIDSMDHLQEEDGRLDAAAPGDNVRQGGGGEGAAEGGGRSNAEGWAARLGHGQCGADGEETGVSSLYTRVDDDHEHAQASKF